jgi:hypothetical protein
MRVQNAESWQRQPHESARAFEAFSRYRDQGANRSIARAWREHQGGKAGPPPTCAPGRWTRWSTQHHWTYRAEAYDRHCDEELLGEAAQFAREDLRRRLRVQARHQRAAELLAAKIIAGLERVEFSSLPPWEYIKCVERVVLLERLVHMAPISGASVPEAMPQPALPAPAPIAKFGPPPGLIEQALAILDARRSAAASESKGERTDVVVEDAEAPALLPRPGAEPKRRESRTPSIPVAAGL